MKNVSFKSCIPYFVAILIFLAISLVYFVPEIFQNKTLYQNDVVTAMGMGQEAKEFAEKTGEKTLWTNSAFGGMPTYQISPSYPSSSILKEIQQISWLYLPAPASYLFIMLIGAFLLFVALRVNPWLAIIGAIAYAFSSYFLIIIEAGHIWKLWVLAYIPPTFAGIIWAYRGKYLVGALVATLYMALQLFSNHPQMTYYFGFIVLIYVIAEFIHSFKNKQLPNFFKASAVLLVSVAIALALNITNLYHTASYTKYTMRGGSELADDKGDNTKGGLERSYATSWSYGIGETFTLLIPNTKGGSSQQFIGCKIVETPQGLSLKRDPLKNKSKLNKIADPQIREEIAQQSYYWGDQPGTSGPVYAGAFIIFLFVLGLFIVKGRFKWVLAIATVLSIVLSWGSNFMWLTNLFLDYFPYYNKMRAVSSMLVIAELCIPVLAILALKEIIVNPEIIKIKKKEFYISLGCTAGLILLLIMVPQLFLNFLSEREEYGFGEMLRNPQSAAIYRPYVDSLEAIRISIFRDDAIRSLLIICVGVAFVMLYGMKKINVKMFVALVAILILFDMWQIDKRYLSGSDFKTKAKDEKVIAKNQFDDKILEDKDLDYRVYNLMVNNPFSDGSTSFYHKSLGGYHGAKIRRYQDIIELYISKVTAKNAQSLLGTKEFDVLNMLNTKYIILPNQLLKNPNALGNAWFIDDIKWVDNANEEVAALSVVNPAKVAVVNKAFEAQLSGFKPNPQQTAVESIDGDVNISGNDAYYFDKSSIKLVEYAPNKLTYKSNTIAQRLAVFSEIYYPEGWKAYIDGNETPILRANYILRAMLIPEGEHTIEFRFDPASYHLTEQLAKWGYALLFGLIAFTIVWATWIRKRKETDINVVE